MTQKEKIEEAKSEARKIVNYSPLALKSRGRMNFTQMLYLLLYALEAAEKERDKWKAKAEAREAEIRKECADIAMRFFYTPEDSEMGEELRAAIMGTD